MGTRSIETLEEQTREQIRVTERVTKDLFRDFRPEFPHFVSLTIRQLRKR